MHLLAREEPSKDVLFKLRNLSNQWKTIGPVGAARINEFRDNFRNLFEQIMTACTPLMEEQNAERKKNLEEKRKSVLRQNFWPVILLKTGRQIQDHAATSGCRKTVGQVPKENNQPLWIVSVLRQYFLCKSQEFLKKEDEERQSNYDKKVCFVKKRNNLKNQPIGTAHLTN
jgi:hypothetical protein